MSTDTTELTGKVVNGIVELDQRGSSPTERKCGSPVARMSKAEGSDASLSKMLLSFCRSD